MSRRSSTGVVIGLLSLAVAAAFSVWFSYADVVRLAERIEEAEAETTVPGARFAAFDDEQRLSRTVSIDGTTRLALTPPFPSKLSFELSVPDDLFLEVAPALVMQRDVGRARVEFVVAVEAEGTTTRVFSKLLDLREANLWHDERIDLERWSGKPIRLTFETRGDPHRGNILWADRVQTAWGDPRLIRRPLASQRAAMAEDLSRATDWLRTQSTQIGVDIEERATLAGFGINLLIAGFLSIIVAELFRRAPLTHGTRGDLGNVLPLLTLVMTVVIAVVHLSVPLSLGLLGALSLIRFRTPIRSGEELLYILIAIALGLILGAGERLIAATTMVVVAALFWVLRVHDEPQDERQLLLSASGSGDDSLEQLEEVLDELGEKTIIQEIATEGQDVMVRALVTVRGSDESKKLMQAIWTRLPTFRVSYRDASGEQL